MKNLKRVIAMCMAVVMVFSMSMISASAANSEVGSEGNPAVVSKFFGTGTYVMNEALEAGDSDGYWYSIPVDEKGILYVEVNCSDEAEYDVVVYVDGEAYFMSDGNPIITCQVNKDSNIIVHKYVKQDSKTGKIVAAKIYVNAGICAGTEDDPLSLKSSPIRVPIAAGDTVYVKDGTKTPDFAGRGLVVSGNAKAIAKATVTVNGVEYTDKDGDGKIELMIPGSYYSRPAIGITNNDNGSFGFTLTAVESAEEGSESGSDQPTENPFTDVPEYEYYYQPVLWAYGNGVTSGLTATEFAPEASCTRGQVVTFLWRAMGCPEPTRTQNPFVDVNSNEYYYKAVLWAAENGITSGLTSTMFGPEETVTRGQVVTFLHRAKNKPAYSASNPFTDVPNGEYYYDAVLWAVENGITSGLNPTTFGSEEFCTRGQIVTFLYRTLNEN